MSDPTTINARHRVLVVGDEQGQALAVLPRLLPDFDTQIARNTNEALEALRQGDFDLILAGSTMLLPLTQAARRERAGSVLEGVAQGACIVGGDGRLIWANAALRAYPEVVIEAVRAACATFLQQRIATGADSVRRVWQQTLRVPPDYVFELSVAAVPPGFDLEPEAVGLFSDMSEVARMRDKLDAIDAAGRELMALSVDAQSELDVAGRLDLIEQKLIRCCRDLLHFTHFAVLVLDPKTQRLEHVLSGGFGDEARSLVIYARPEGNGISGYVAATGQSYICPDIASDARYLKGIEHAASSLTVPLRLIDRIVGVLNVESDTPAAFNEQDRQFAEIFGRYIAVALHTLKLLVSERYEAAGQVTADVTSSITEPLDTIVADLSRVLDSGQISDEVQHRLRGALAQVDRVKQALRIATEPAPIRGLSPDAGVETDPLLDRKRILIADDEDIIRETLAEFLTKSGAIPSTARDGDDAIAMLRAQPFDLVLSDIKMPNKSGYEVFAAAKAASATCPVILITGFGYDPEHNIVRANREGLAGVLFKPFKVEALLDLIHKALAQPKP
jgi:CheY-like chemotaxis protein/GAF domain-containing protein